MTKYLPFKIQCWLTRSCTAFLHIKLLLKLVRARACMEQNDKQTFWRFTIRYNVILLGALYLAILVMATFTLKSRMQGVMHIELMLIYLVTLLVSFGSWIFCIIKSWKLTKFDLKLRVAAMAYLFGCPLVLLYISFPIMFFILRLMGVWSPIR